MGDGGVPGPCETPSYVSLPPAPPGASLCPGQGLLREPQTGPEAGETWLRPNPWRPLDPAPGEHGRPQFPCGSRTGWPGALRGQQSADMGSSRLPAYVSGPKNNRRGGAPGSSCQAPRARAELPPNAARQPEAGAALTSASSRAAPGSSPGGRWPGAEPDGCPEPTRGQRVLGSWNLDIMGPKIY